MISIERDWFLEFDFVPWYFAEIVDYFYSFLVKYLGSLMYNTMSSTNRDNLTSFPICIPLTSFSFLIATARASGTILKRTGDGLHLFLISMRFSPFRIMSAMCLSHIAYIVLNYISSSLTI